MKTSSAKKNRKRTVQTKASCFSAAIDGFQGGPEAVRAVVEVAGRFDVKSPDAMRSMARYVFDRALQSQREQLKGFAVLARRLSDRLPRIGTHGSGEQLSFAAALHELCASQFERMCTLEPPRDPSTCRGSNDENQENDVHQHAEDPLFSALEEGKEEDKCTDLVCPHAGDPSGHTQDTIQHLLMLQLFSACLYTQDVVPEEFVHKIMDFHRFSSGSSWPSELRSAGLGSAVEMMTFCGKRLERLGSLKHVMPDFYTFLGDVARDPECPQELHNQIFHALQLRDNDWVLETLEDPDPLTLLDPPVLGS